MAAGFRLRAAPWTRCHPVLGWEALLALGHSRFNLPVTEPGWRGPRPGSKGCQGTLGGWVDVCGCAGV